MSVINYLFSIGSEPFTLASSSNLTDQDVKHLLAQNALSFTFQDVSRVLLDGGLPHHTHGAVARTTR